MKSDRNSGEVRLHPSSTLQNLTNKDMGKPFGGALSDIPAFLIKILSRGEASSLPAGRQGEPLEKQHSVTFNELEFTKGEILPRPQKHQITAFRSLEGRPFDKLRALNLPKGLPMSGL